MTERLLQYIWQFRYFNQQDLRTTDGQLLQIIQPGSFNTNQGADFLDAKIKIGETLWAGSVEVHVNASEWNQHKHSSDKNYNNVILHVVWNNDVELGLSFHTLELHDRVSNLLLNRYAELMQDSPFIPCEKQLKIVDALVLNAWKERLLVERLQNKARHIESMLKENNQHWEETCWWMLARNFGARVNSDAFEKMARSISTNLLGKHKQQLLQLEALLMGQSGLLEKDFEEDYPIMLQKEYRFLRKKYNLVPIHSSLYFLRMRPANFPGIRLAQLAALIFERRHLFSTIIESGSLAEIEKIFTVTANDYWHYHYIFDAPVSFKKKTLGGQMIRNIIINTVVPLLYAYGYFHNKERYKVKALQFLEMTVAEKNNIVDAFEKHGMQNKTAYDSQAWIQLKNEYCDNKRCLQCAIGNNIMSNADR